MSELLHRAFPSSVREAVDTVVVKLPPPKWEPLGRFTVLVEGEHVEIPERIYHPELPESVTVRWPQVQRDVCSCLYTRHHDGYTRQRHLRNIISRSDPWVAPFVVQLIGEYVVEILTDIERGLTDLEVDQSAQQTQYATFAAANPRFMALTSARVMSYWNCYYRLDYRSFGDYPGSRLIESLRRVAAQRL